MQIEATPEILNNISALSELGNTIEEAAAVMCVPFPALVELLTSNTDARDRWARGGIESQNKLLTCLARQAVAGSVQAAKILLEHYDKKSEKNAPISPAPSSTPQKLNDEGWASIENVAEQIGVTSRAIRKRIDHATWPKLETREVKGVRCVGLRATYDHFITHGTRRPDGLHKPAGYDSKPAADRPPTSVFDLVIDPEITAALGGLNPMDMEPGELSKRLVLGNVSSAKARLAIMWNDSHQRRKSAELKAASMLGTDVVRKMIRAHAEFIKETADKRDRAFAEELLRFVSVTFPGIDLVAKRPDALALFACFYREDMNRLFLALENLIKDQMQGIRELEFKSVERSA